VAKKFADAAMKTVAGINLARCLNEKKFLEAMEYLAELVDSKISKIVSKILKYVEWHCHLFKCFLMEKFIQEEFLKVLKPKFQWNLKNTVIKTLEIVEAVNYEVKRTAGQIVL
jgi:ribosomal protein L22